jgi:hypothetical protein
MNVVMGCEEVQEYLAERLAGSLSDRLSGTVHSLVRTHMLSCPECCEEMEHFEDMQRVLQTIPVEPCDSNAMRARFHLLMGPKESETLRRQRVAPRIRPLKIALVSIASIVAVIATFLAVRQAVKWISVARVAPPFSTPAATPSPKPVAEPVRTEAISGQVQSTGTPSSPAASLEKAQLTGRILLEDGSEVSDSQSLGKIAIYATGKSASAAMTTLRLDGNGRFDRTLASGEYRFRITEFSQNYLVRSIASGGTDLLKEDLKISGDSPVSVEIWVSRRNDTGTGKVIGRVLDGVTNAPSQADRVVLCCFASGPAERLSTPLRSDGSFEFDEVPSGSYTAELHGGRNLAIVNPAFNVTAAGVSGLKLISTPQVVAVDVTLRLDTGGRLPYRPDTSIVFTGTTGAIRVAASCVVGNLFRASVPADEPYTLTVSNVAAGYDVRSIVDSRMTDLMYGGLFTPAGRVSAPSSIVVTLTKN